MEETTQAVVQETLEVGAELAEDIARLNPDVIIETMKGWIPGLMSFGYRLFAAAVILLIGSRVIKFTSKFLKRTLDKMGLEIGISRFLVSVAKAFQYGILIFIAAEKIGISSASIIALLGSAGIAIGLALQGTLTNFAGGVLILVTKPFKVGDYIEAQGQSGTVKEIQIFNTIITTTDNKVIIIPNGGLSTGIMMNYSKESQRRVDWVFGIGYGDSYEHAKAVIARLLDNDPRVLKDPNYFIALTALNSSSVDIVVRAWVKAENYWGVFFDMNEKVYKTFAEENLNIPFPQMDVHLYNEK